MKKGTVGDDEGMRERNRDGVAKEIEGVKLPCDC